MKPILPDLPMPIITPRLFIRPPQIGDAVIVNEAVAESFEQLHPFMEWAIKMPTLEETEEFIKHSVANWKHKKNEEPWLQLLIFDKETHQFIGGTSFYNIAWEIPAVETGYWIRTSRAQQGLMTEAMNAMTQYSFKQLNVKRIAITCDVNNQRSKKIPERLGYYLEGILKFHRKNLLTQKISDTTVYARYNLTGLPPLDVQWNNP